MGVKGEPASSPVARSRTLLTLVAGIASYCTWKTVSAGVSLSGKHAQAKTGELTDYEEYRIENIVYPLYFFAAALTILLLTGLMLKRPGQTELTQWAISRFAVSLKCVAIYSGWQVLWRWRDLMMMMLAWPCKSSGAASVGLLGFNVSCNDIAEHAYPLPYFDILQLSLILWVTPMSFFGTMVVGQCFRRTRVADEEGQRSLKKR